MKSSPLLLGLALVASALPGLSGCSSDDGTTPGSTPPKSDYTIDTFNVGLAGAFLPFEQERKQPLVDAFAASDADVLCLQEVWRESDKDMIATGAAANYPYVARFKHDLSTPVDDPTDQNGNTPPVPTTPPCADAGASDKLNKVLQCLADNCSTVPGSLDGMTTSTDCAEQKCTAEAIALLFGTDEEKRCYGCAATSLPDSSLSEIKTDCTTLPNAGLAFDGQSGVMVLSKHPITKSDDIVIPGTWNRRVILTATVQLPSGVGLDVYCNHLSPVFTGPTFPYTGPYGDGKTGAEGWAAEQLLQANKLMAYVENLSGANKAVILGDLNAGHAYKEGEPDGFHAEAEETLNLLETRYTEALTAGYVPRCTHCSSNPNTGKADAADSSWIDHIYLSNIGVDLVTEATRTYDEATVDVMVDDGNGGTEAGKVPLSDHYGMRATITIVP